MYAISACSSPICTARLSAAALARGPASTGRVKDSWTAPSSRASPYALIRFVSVIALRLPQFSAHFLQEGITVSLSLHDDSFQPFAAVPGALDSGEHPLFQCGKEADVGHPGQKFRSFGQDLPGASFDFASCPDFQFL